jgi:hypothetical protein
MASPFVSESRPHLAYNAKGDLCGAQTERRGGAGPVKGLLGGKDLTGRYASFLAYFLFLTSSSASR